MMASCDDWTTSARSRVRCSAARRPETSRTAAQYRWPPAASSGDRLISTGNSRPSLRSPYMSRPAPIGRTRRVAEYPGPVPGMQAPEPFRDQHLDLPPDQFGAVIAEQRFHLGVDELD